MNVERWGFPHSVQAHLIPPDSVHHHTYPAPGADRLPQSVNILARPCDTLCHRRAGLGRKRVRGLLLLLESFLDIILRKPISASLRRLF